MPATKPAVLDTLPRITHHAWKRLALERDDDPDKLREILVEILEALDKIGDTFTPDRTKMHPLEGKHQQPEHEASP